MTPSTPALVPELWPSYVLKAWLIYFCFFVRWYVMSVLCLPGLRGTEPGGALAKKLFEMSLLSGLFEKSFLTERKGRDTDGGHVLVS